MTNKEHQLPAKITLKWLQKHGACTADLERFPDDFPDGHDLSLESLTKAAEASYDLMWLADIILTTPAWKAFEKAKAKAWEAYEKATTPARKACEKATAPARKAYQKATTPARKAYQKATAPAWEAYKKATAPAWEAYQKAKVTALYDAIQSMEVKL